MGYDFSKFLGADLPAELTAALAFAEQAHGEQRYGDRPYIEHVMEVVAIARWAGCSLRTQIAAALHDVLEDTGVTYQELRARFGEDVAQDVWSVSGEGASRREKQQSIVAKLQAHQSGVDLKLCDRIANIEACLRDGLASKLRMYRKEHESYAIVFATGREVLQGRLNSILG